VFQLRNTLVHYQPENMPADWELVVKSRLQSLRGRFDNNRLMAGSGNPWWPDHCLGHGCAEWSVQSVVGLADHVSDLINLQLNYRRLGSDGYGQQPGLPVHTALCS
jgi:hypothetical protein